METDPNSYSDCIIKATLEKTRNRRIVHIPDLKQEWYERRIYPDGRILLIPHTDKPLTIEKPSIRDLMEHSPEIIHAIYDPKIDFERS